MISTGSKVLALALTASMLSGFFGYQGYKYGVKITQAEWDIERVVLHKAALEKEKENKRKEEEHRKEVQSLEDEIRKSREEYEKSVADLESDFARSLHESEKRASTYRRWAEASSTERRGLADHAAQLDQSLTEGRSLVEELRGLVKQRDKQLIQLGKQLKADRALIGETK